MHWHMGTAGKIIMQTRPRTYVNVSDFLEDSMDRRDSSRACHHLCTVGRMSLIIICDFLLLSITINSVFFFCNIVRIVQVISTPSKGHIKQARDRSVNNRAPCLLRTTDLNILPEQPSPPPRRRRRDNITLPLQITHALHIRRLLHTPIRINPLPRRARSRHHNGSTI
jgi:hypothetical protein